MIGSSQASEIASDRCNSDDVSVDKLVTFPEDCAAVAPRNEYATVHAFRAPVSIPPVSWYGVDYPDILAKLLPTGNRRLSGGLVAQ